MTNYQIVDIAGAGLDTWSHNIVYKLACRKILFNILLGPLCYRCKLITVVGYCVGTGLSCFVY